jgi:hypothetical protein
VVSNKKGVNTTLAEAKPEKLQLLAEQIAVEARGKAGSI